MCSLKKKEKKSYSGREEAKQPQSITLPCLIVAMMLVILNALLVSVQMWWEMHLAFFPFVFPINRIFSKSVEDPSDSF